MAQDQGTWRFILCHYQAIENFLNLSALEQKSLFSQSCSIWISSRLSKIAKARALDQFPLKAQASAVLGVLSPNLIFH